MRNKPNTYRDLKEALDRFVEDVNEYCVMEVGEFEFTDYAGIWGEDLYRLARKDSRLEWKSEKADDGIEDLYVLPAGRFKSVKEAEEAAPISSWSLYELSEKLDEEDIKKAYKFISSLVNNGR